MNIHELDSYDLGDAVKFNDRLNPAIWDDNERMRPEVREQLLRIADDFREFLGIDVEVKDITVSGSNAAYTYTPHSDIDLHLVVDLPRADENAVYRELFDAKKYAYNDMHDIKIGGADVELYVQDANKTHHSQGIYSIQNDDWVSVPRRRRPDVDDISVKSKFEDLGHRIESAIATGDLVKITDMAEKLRDYRQAGLDAHGEFGAENLAFKILRTQGLITKLYDARNKAKDDLLSLDERKRKKKKRSVKYGYGGYWYPGTAYAGQDHPAGTEVGDGGGGDGGESLREGVPDTEQILRDFVEFAMQDLGIQQMPTIKLRRDPQWPVVNRTFGRYNNDAQTLEVAWGQRHIMDVLRTVAHELTHKHQHEREGDSMGDDAGETGSPYENEANARAGILMRDYAALHPEYFTAGQAHDLEEDQANKTSVLQNRLPPKLVISGYTFTLDPVTRQVTVTHGGKPFKSYRYTGPKNYDAYAANAYHAISGTQPRDLAAIEKRDRGSPTAAQQSFEYPKGSGYGVAVRDQDLERAYSQHDQDTEGHGDVGGITDLGKWGAIQKRRRREVEKPEDEVKESASGYIPTKAQAKDPRYSMALTVDVKPGQVGKEANKLKLKTNRQGQPQIARADGLFEELMLEFQLAKEGIDAPITKTKDQEQYYKFIVAKAKMGRPLTRGEQDFVKMYQMYRQQKLAEVSDDRLQRYLSRAGQQVDRRQTRMAQVRDRLNKGYEIYHAEDPTFIVHRFEANTPAEAQRYYETFIDRYESDRDFDLQLRRSTGLMEAFNAPYPMTWEHSKDSHDALVKLPDGTNLSIMFSKEYMFGDEEDWHVEFWRNNSQEVTGEGDAQRVFATVLNAIQQFIKIEDPERIRFSASKDQEADSRTNLYGSLVRRYANAWGYEVDSSEYGGSTVYNLYKLYEQDLNEDEELDEVKMSPGALEKFATSDAAKGIRAGFEAELIFRDTQGSSDDIDPEPDYDADERAYSISQVIEFFDNDEYGYGLSDRERNRLEEQLDETYMNWRDDQIISDFRNDAEDLIREKLLDETPLSERIHLYLTDSEQMSDKEADRIIAAGVDAPRFNTSKEQQAYAAENPYYQAYLDAADAAELELDESVEYSVSQQDEYWDEALDDYRDNWSGDDDSFFSDVGLRWMSDIANEFGLDWPVWNMDSGRNNGSRSWEDIGNELQAVVDMPVVVSDNYHSTRRRPGQWILEPDGSLGPDDQSEEAGLEIVSPPMPLLTAIEKLKQVTDWANDPNGGNAYTNGTTGLHMGVSLPRFTSEDADSDAGIDYVKLILFMGDKYVLQQFGRTANTYAASALDKLKQNVKGKRSDPAGVVELLRYGLTELAYRELQKGVGTSKYTSAHIQDGYIEFRSPGGDWLAKSDEEIGILENTMLRFARAMAIAGDPSAERQEYAKKLYKLVTQDNEQYADQLRLFSEFSAGTINREQLKKQWADTVLQKEIPGSGKEEYEVFRTDNNDSPDGIVGTLYAKDYDDAFDQFMKQYGGDVNTSAYLSVRLKQPWFDVQDATGKTILTMRAPNIDKAQQRVEYEYGERARDWNVYRRPDETPEPKVSPRAQVAKRIVTKPKTATQYNYDIVDQRTVELRVVDQFRAETPQEAERVYSAWLKSKDLPDDTANYGYRKNEQAADDQRDSVDIQRSLGVQDVDTDVAQNFSPDLSAYERNSDRIDAIRAQTQQPRQNYELVSDEDPDRVLHRMNDATADEVRAWIAQQEAGGMPPGFLRTRIVAEAIDPVSGAGAVPPRQDPKNTGKKTVPPVEKARQDHVKGLPYRSAIGQAISKKDLDNMTQQIKIARKLGDSVMEMEDTPPEVMQALNQAAQKNGYRNWADVKANPRSPQAVMTVAKLANTMLKAPGPRREKVFYKNKLDK